MNDILDQEIECKNGNVVSAYEYSPPFNWVVMQNDSAGYKLQDDIYAISKEDARNTMLELIEKNGDAIKKTTNPKTKKLVDKPTDVMNKSNIEPPLITKEAYMCRADFLQLFEQALKEAGGSYNEETIQAYLQMPLWKIINQLANNGIRMVYNPEYHMDKICDRLTGVADK